jgi:hypothetical protein
MACYRDSFTLLLLYFYVLIIIMFKDLFQINTVN